MKVAEEFVGAERMVVVTHSVESVEVEFADLTPSMIACSVLVSPISRGMTI